MIWLSEILMKRHDIQCFDELVAAVRDEARNGGMFFRMDIKPPYPDTPPNWEDQLESAFTGTVD